MKWEFKTQFTSPKIMDHTIPTTGLLNNSNLNVQQDISIPRLTFCEGFDLTLKGYYLHLLFELARRAVEGIVSSIIVGLVKMKFDNIIH